MGVIKSNGIFYLSEIIPHHLITIYFKIQVFGSTFPKNMSSSMMKHLSLFLDFSPVSGRSTITVLIHWQIYEPMVSSLLVLAPQLCLRPSLYFSDIRDFVGFGNIFLIWSIDTLIAM